MSRKPRERAADQFYRDKFGWHGDCIYCGQPAECRDHVYPLVHAATLDLTHPSVRHVLWRGLVRVPACNECNTIAGFKAFYDPISKRHYIQAALRRRYKRHLRGTLWSRRELAELGDTLKSKVESDLRRMLEVELRVNHPSRYSRVIGGLWGLSPADYRKLLRRAA